MKYYLKIQLLRLHREIDDRTPHAAIGYLILSFAFLFGSQYTLESLDPSGFLYALFPLAFIVRANQYRNVNFLKILYSEPEVLKVSIFENLIIGLPFSVVLMVSGHYGLSAIILLVSVLIALAPQIKMPSMAMKTPFGKWPFEFAAGFRKYFYWILIAYAISIISALTENFNIGIFSIFIIYVTTSSFYLKTEEASYVWIYRMNPKGFLKHKLTIGLWNTFYLSIFPMLIMLIKNPLNYELVGMSILVFSLYLALIILSKYAAFPEEIGVSQGVLIGMSVFFPPAIIGILPYMYQQAQKGLKQYLDD